MEKYYDHRPGKEYTKIESFLSSSEYLKGESEIFKLPKWVELIDFYISKFENEKQEAEK